MLFDIKVKYMKTLYDVQNHILIVTNNVKPCEHKHMASHIIISLDDNIKLISNDKEYIARGFMIPSGVSHIINTGNSSVMVFMYDNTTNVSKNIKHIDSVSEDKCEEIAQLFYEFKQNNSHENYHKLHNVILDLVDIPLLDTYISDCRIKETIESINSDITDGVLCSDIAKKVYLSESRFSHLFKEQTGMTFSAYLIYQRIISVYKDILNGKSITESAINAGFCSSSHFADINRRVFGLSASDITKNLIFKKII